MSDDEIDYSDIPKLDETFWSNATLCTPSRPHNISILIDKDILEWFKSQGPMYQAHVNDVLRRYMESQKSYLRT
ncbi:BrnA antitoxin family protein [Desulfamplus magnetovallimortis]